MLIENFTKIKFKTFLTDNKKIMNFKKFKNSLIFNKTVLNFIKKVLIFKKTKMLRNYQFSPCSFIPHLPLEWNLVENTINYKIVIN